MIGVYARTDVERGVHKAPANTVLRGIVPGAGLASDVTRREQDTLNPVGINVLRAFRASDGPKVWEHSFAKGTSIQGGAVVAGGMMFVGGGFHSALGNFRKGEGTELRAFALDGR